MAERTIEQLNIKFDADVSGLKKGVTEAKSAVDGFESSAKNSEGTTTFTKKLTDVAKKVQTFSANIKGGVTGLSNYAISAYSTATANDQLSTASVRAAQGISSIAAKTLASKLQLNEYNAALSRLQETMDILAVKEAKLKQMLDSGNISMTDYRRNMEELALEGLRTSEQMDKIREKIQSIAGASKKAAEGVNSFKAKIQAASSKVVAFGAVVGSLIAIITAVVAVLAVFTRGIRQVSEAASVQETAETKLETVMKKRMNATKAGIESIKSYCAALQQVGVVGDEVGIAGAAQLATFVNNEKAVKNLIPAMENLAASLYGAEVNSDQMSNIANMVGKALANDSLASLTRVGITVTPQETATWERLNNELDKSALLAQIITNNVGNMNTAIAGTYAGRVAQLRNAFGDLKEEIGYIVQYLLAPLITGLTKVIQLVSSAVARMRKMFGIEKQIGVATNDTAIATESFSVSTANAASNIKRASNSAKKLAATFKGLVGIDEINTLQKVNDSISGDTSIGGNTIETPDIDTGVVEDVITNLNNMDITETWMDKLKRFFKNLPSNIVYYAKDFWQSFASGCANLWDISREKLATGFDKFRDYFKGRWDSMLNGLKKFRTWVLENFPTAADVKSKVSTVFKNIWDKVPKFKVDLGDLKDKTISLKAKVQYANKKVFDELSNKWAAFKDKHPVLTAKVSGFSAKVSEFFANWIGIKDKNAKLTAEVQDKTANSDSTLAKIRERFAAISSKKAVLSVYVKESSQKLRENITEFWKTVKTKSVTFTAEFRDKVSNGFKTAVNSIIRGVNKVIDGFNKINVIGKIKGTQVAHIPLLARGGVVTSSTIANIGERGREAVIPLERNTGWMDTLATSLVAKMNAFGAAANDKPLEITLNIGGTRFGHAVIKSINEAQAQSGAILLNI